MDFICEIIFYFGNRGSALSPLFVAFRATLNPLSGFYRIKSSKCTSTIMEQRKIRNRTGKFCIYAVMQGKIKNTVLQKKEKIRHVIYTLEQCPNCKALRFLQCLS